MKSYFGAGFYKNYRWLRCCRAALGLKVEGLILSRRRWIQDANKSEFYEMEPPPLTFPQGRFYGQ